MVLSGEHTGLGLGDMSSVPNCATGLHCNPGASYSTFPSLLTLEPIACLICLDLKLIYFYIADLFQISK